MIIKEILQQNPLTRIVDSLPNYPLHISHFHSQHLNPSWLDSISHLNFQPSHYGIHEVGQEQRIYDRSVRNSQLLRVHIPELDTIANQYVREWSQSPLQGILSGEKFNCLRYQNGHFDWHVDKIRVREGYQHIGTIIFIPPTSLCSYKGGTLVVVDISEKEILVDPEEQEWTMVLMPIGYQHTVERVRGLRYSFTREIHLREGHGMRRMGAEEKERIKMEYKEYLKSMELRNP